MKLVVMLFCTCALAGPPQLTMGQLVDQLTTEHNRWVMEMTNWATLYTQSVPGTLNVKALRAWKEGVEPMWKETIRDFKELKLRVENE